jgi:hypothetical protein
MLFVFENKGEIKMSRISDGLRLARSYNFGYQLFYYFEIVFVFEIQLLLNFTRDGTLKTDDSNLKVKSSTNY